MQLPPQLAARIRDEARRCYPAEACGFLIGGIDGATARVRDVRPERNRSPRRDRFYIDAADVFAAGRAARAAGEELIGVFHSHPDGAPRPSATDRREAWGGWLHVIVACAAGEPGVLACWREAEGGFEQVAVREEVS